MSKIKWIIFGLISVGIIAGLVIYSNSTKEKTNLPNDIDAYAVQEANASNGKIADHVYSNNDSKVILIEYGDYQCPGCASFNPTVEKIAEEYKDKIKYIFRNYLLSYHANSKAAAAAAESAGLQGKYWEAHKKLYATQSEWEYLDSNERTDYFIKLAKNLGLDTTKFADDMASTAISDKIAYDVSLATKSKLSSTPSFYLNGSPVDSKTWSDEDKLRALLDSKIEELK